MTPSIPPPLGSGHRVPHNQFLKFLSKNLMSVRLFSLLWGTYVKMQGSFTWSFLEVVLTELCLSMNTKTKMHFLFIAQMPKKPSSTKNQVLFNKLLPFSQYLYKTMLKYLVDWYVCTFQMVHVDGRRRLNIIFQTLLRQWGREYWTCMVFEWLKVDRIVNVRYSDGKKQNVALSKNNRQY